MTSARCKIKSAGSRFQTARQRLRPDGDTISFVNPSSVSTNGGTVRVETNMVIYTPAAGFTGTDAFSYTIATGVAARQRRTSSSPSSPRRRRTSHPGQQPYGLSSVIIIATNFATITNVRVSLVVTGSFNGDLFCSLSHGGKTSVLLNRAGRRAARPTVTVIPASTSCSTMRL